MYKVLGQNKRKFMALIVIISLVFTLSACQSEQTGETNTGEEIERALTPEQFEEKLAEDGVVVVDLRRDEELEELGKYKDSIQVPNELVQDDPEAALAMLPEDKDTTLLIHCKSGGRASKSIDVFVQDFGFKNAYYLASPITFNKDGEIRDYVLRSLNPEKFEEMLAKDGVVVIDLRRDEELEELGQYKDSIQVPNELVQEDPEAAMALLPEDKDTTLLIHCKSGGRAGKSIYTFVDDFGYKNAYYLASQIIFTEDGEIRDYTIRALNSDKFEEMLAQEGVVVVDIRRQDELDEVGKYKDSIHVPSELIQEDPEEAAKLLPEDKETTLLIHCKSGGRAGKAIDIVAKDLGYKNAYYLAGPIFFNEDGSIKGYEE